MKGFISFILLCTLSTQVLAAEALYILQPGDQLSVTVWQDERLSRGLVVRPDGRISFPLAGHMSAAGVTAEQLEANLKARLKRFYKDDLDVNVMVIQVVPPTVYITGEVARPGSFPMVNPTTALQAIAMAGGLGPFAAESRIKIRRKVNGKEVSIPFNYRDAVAGRVSKGNVYLLKNDVIIVPERNLFGDSSD